MFGISAHDWYHFWLILCGVMSVHIWNWVEKQWKRRRQIKAGHRWECSLCKFSIDVTATGGENQIAGRLILDEVINTHMLYHLKERD